MYVQNSSMISSLVLSSQLEPSLDLATVLETFPSMGRLVARARTMLVAD
jgi:hypothetical protein